MFNELYLCYIFVFLIGSCIGSFLNVCIYRLPLEKSIISPPSACPKCNHQIKWYENLPIISYIFLGGKCSQCKEKISIRYPFVELLTGVLSLLSFMKFGPTPLFFINTLLIHSLIVITFIDLDHQIIPDIISLPGIIIGFLFSFIPGGITWSDSIIGILLGGGLFYGVALLFYLLFKKEGMGGGDIKLLAMLGAFLGWKSVPFVIFASALVGAIGGISFIIISKSKESVPIPYGPYLAFAALIYLFYGKEIVSFYLQYLL